jgi:hypothetical protein
MFIKCLSMSVSGLVALGLGALAQGPPRPPDGPPPPKAEKAVREAGHDLKKAYDLLSRLRADEGPAGRPGERLRDWAERAVGLYRQGLKAYSDGEARLAHEYGAAAHDLARALDHARNAERLDRLDGSLPPPPEEVGPDPKGDPLLRDLRHAYDRIQELDNGAVDREARFYLDAARDLYSAARRAAERGRTDRATELARAAEAMTHVPEHLGHAREAGNEPPPPDPKKEAPKQPRRPEPPDRPGRELPPPLPE